MQLGRRQQVCGRWHLPRYCCSRYLVGWPSCLQLLSESMKPIIKQQFSVTYRYDIHFTAGLFTPENPLLGRFFSERLEDAVPKLLVVLDEGVAKHHPILAERIH